MSGKMFDASPLDSKGEVISITYYDEQGNVLGTVDHPQQDMPATLHSPELLMLTPPPPSSTSPTGVKPPPSADSLETEEDFMFAEQMPEFPGNNFSQFLVQNIRYPETAKDAGVQGTVYVSFVVNKYGGIEDLQVVKGVPKGGSLLDKEALRVMQMMPPWKPGMMNGRPVRVVITQPIRFVLQ